MKKLIFTVLAVLTGVVSAEACTNMIVGKKASADGSVMVSYNADSFGMFGNLYHWRAGAHAAGEMRQVYDWDSGRYLGEIPEAPYTYNVVGNMNEKQLCITETTFGGRREARDKNAVIDYGSLIYITLQRAATAREAINTMNELVTKYGYASMGESFSICDKEEAWILEMMPKGTNEDGSVTGAVWVAIRIPDDCISGHANQARITTFAQTKKMDKKLGYYNVNDEVLYSADVIAYARKMGWYEGADADFNWRNAYHPLTFSGIRACDARVWSIFRKFDKSMDNENYHKYISGDVTAEPMPLYIKPDHKVTLREVKDCMRDHYEGTFIDPTVGLAAGPFATPYRAPGSYKTADGRTTFVERPVGTQQSAFALVGQLRSWLPDEVGGILWFNTDDANMITYVPVYCSTTKVPFAFSEEAGGAIKFSMDCAFWLNNMVANYVYPRYSMVMPTLREAQKEMDDYFEGEQAKVAEEAAKKNGDALDDFLTGKTQEYTDKYMARWKQLFETIVVAYNDGVVKPIQNGKVVEGRTQRPGRAEQFNAEVVKATGERWLNPKQ